MTGKDKQCCSDQQVSQHQQLTKEVKAEYGERDFIPPLTGLSSAYAACDHLLDCIKGHSQKARLHIDWAQGMHGELATAA